MSPVAILILAAGGSSRLGRPKQLLPFRGTTLIRHAATTATAARLGPVLAVLGATAGECERELQDLPVRIVHNKDWEAGIGTSIRAAVAALDDFVVDGALLCLCDQPLVTSDDLRDLVSVWRGAGAPAAAARYKDTIGVPAVFARSEFAALVALDDTTGAKTHLNTLGERIPALDMPQAQFDIDTPADLTRFS